MRPLPASASAAAPASTEASSQDRSGDTSGDTSGAADPLVALGEHRLLGTYRQAPFVLERGVACTVYDTRGRRYLDLCAGVAVSALGHAHPRLTATIVEQAGKLMHVSNYFYNAENVRLAAELCDKTGYDRAFFCNSGAEAVEAMLKLARRHFFAQGQVDRYRIIAFNQSFHGRTLGAIAVTGNTKYREGFGPTLAGVTLVNFGDAAAVRAAMGPDVAAILVEPVQGEGGVFPAPDGFLAELRRITDEHGALLLIDEVQTGMGRTGRLLGSEHDGVTGDAITLAKGLGGGFPIGALLVREKLAGALPPGTHGSTFGGNALASAAARTVLAVLEDEGLITATAEKGERLGKALAALAARYPKLCKGERGRGLLRGLVLQPGVDARVVLTKIRERGVLLTIAGSDAIRFSPPLIVTDAELDEGLRAVDSVLAEMSSEA